MKLLPDPERILISRMDRIGDFVLSTPVLAALRKRFPKAWIACLTFLENRHLIQGNPNVDEVLLYDKKGSEKGWLGNWCFANRIKRKKFDVMIHLHATNRSHVLGWLANIPFRIGWKRKSAWMLTHAYEDVKRYGQKHEAEYNFDLLNPFGMSRPDALEVFVPLCPQAEQSLDMLLKQLNITNHKPWIAVNPSASCPSKRWKPQLYAELITQIHDQYDVDFVAIGSLQDRDIIQTIQCATDVPVCDLSGRLSLAMLAHFFKKTTLLISNDSGPVHIADGLGVPVISIFGRNDPGLSPTRWRPLSSGSTFVWKNIGCDPCLAHRCEINFLCLDAVSIDSVLSEVQKRKHLFSKGGR